MNTSGEVADLMVKESMEITEQAVKLAGLGAKNLAAIITALLNDETKLKGKTNLDKLLKSDKPLCILQIKEADLKKFNDEARKYGVLFTVVKDKTQNMGLCDVIAKQEDVAKLNYIMERMGYPVPTVNTEEKTEDKQKEESKDKPNDKSNNKSNEKSKSEPNRRTQANGKNTRTRANGNRSGNRYTKRGDTAQTNRSSKPSVRVQINQAKSNQAQSRQTPSKQGGNRTAPNVARRRVKVKKKER